jgi:hypothetical protein
MRTRIFLALPAAASLRALFPALLLTGCMLQGGIAPHSSTGAEVRAALGIPTDVRFDRNGEELWEYARGPGGHETHLVRLGADGKVREVVQLLTEERLMSLTPGQSTKPEVRHVLGRPSDISYPRAGEAWSWRFHFGGGEFGHLVVTFNPDDTVKERMLIRDAVSGDRDRGSK